MNLISNGSSIVEHVIYFNLESMWHSPPMPIPTSSIMDGPYICPFSQWIHSLLKLKLHRKLLFWLPTKAYIIG
jgi:hypothetical protein